MTIPINSPMGVSVLEIRFGDTVEITEADGSTTAWLLQLKNGKPVLKPTSALPTMPGMYAPLGKIEPITEQRRLVLSTDGVWSWLDFTRGGSLEPVEIDQIEHYSDSIHRVLS